ncbi:hypothetical protein JM18_002541 [Phytophthora kernoviae]|uniref:Uncharacterized protein n=2 Tax=Phytophthora kernoviae TaxID=325452 RepID=A0A922AQT1_9STRA|nr:hypothetical protein G195_003456 [Phytophthora kernoviae 00238/432]KAG2529068.1 hypothetical protein JM18_002541 [Phytophthora kernoviae]
MDPSATASPDGATEVERLRMEVHSKEEALNALKAKTKAFVDNMRNQLTDEKKKVTSLEKQLQESTAAAATATPSSASADNGAEKQRLSEEIEKLKKETAARENDFKARAKSYADSMNSQLEMEREKVRNLEQQMQQQKEALTLAEAAVKTANEQPKDLLADLVPVNSHSDDEFNALQAQLNSVNFEMAALREQLRTVEAEALQSSEENARSYQELEALRVSTEQQLDALRVSSEQQRVQLQEEVNSLRAQESSLQTELSSKQAESKIEETSHVEADLAKLKELEYQLEQHKIENQHLQKQLSDKDYHLEQLDSYRQRADDSDTKVIQSQGEIATLQSQLQASQSEISMLQSQLQAKCDELTSFSCTKCAELDEKLSEITQLYEKVNLGRSRSDSLIAETQSQLGEMQTIKQQYVASQERLEDFMKQNMKLNEMLSEKEVEVATLKAEMKKWSVEMSELQTQHNVLKTDNTEHRQRSASVNVDFQKTEESLKDLQTKCGELEKKNKELSTSIEAINADNKDKRQKAKALVQSLVGEKTNLQEAKSELQKEVDRLRMEVNQRNVENDQQLKQVRDETNEKASQNASTVQSLTDEIAALKRTLTTVQESEKVQQRAKELAAAKREIEDSNKKRLAAKAETQKLAVELENAHKCLDHIMTHVNANCTENVQQIALVQGHVKEAIQVLEKRAATSNPQGKKQTPDDADAEVRKAEEISGVRNGSVIQNPGAKRLEENVTRVSEQLRLLVDITEQLCDIAMEQNDVNLKDVVVNMLSHTFTQCFSDKLANVYSKADEAVSLLDSHTPTSETSNSAVRPIG